MHGSTFRSVYTSWAYVWSMYVCVCVCVCVFVSIGFRIGTTHSYSLPSLTHHHTLYARFFFLFKQIAVAVLHSDTGERRWICVLSVFPESDGHELSVSFFPRSFEPHCCNLSLFLSLSLFRSLAFSRSLHHHHRHQHLLTPPAPAPPPPTRTLTFPPYYRYQCTHLVVYEILREKLNPNNEYDPRTHLLSGGGAGAFAAAITNPFDVTKTLLNTQVRVDRYTIAKRHARCSTY